MNFKELLALLAREDFDKPIILHDANGVLSNIKVNVNDEFIVVEPDKG